MSAQRFEHHARNVAVITFVSRIFGLLRDAVFSRVFGDSAAMSAFFTAFVIPNVFRRLFGEGALSAAFIPEYAQLLKHDPKLAARFASLTVAMLTLALGALTALVLAALAALRWLTPFGDEGATGGLVFELAMLMLPFMPLVCLTAILGGMLQTHGRFAPHAGSPIVLNICMIAGATLWGVTLDKPAEQSVWAVAVAVVVAGVLQLMWALAALRPHIAWSRVTDGAGEAVRRMLNRMGPVIIGMGALQLGTLIDTLIAGWPVMIGPNVPFSDSPYPLDESSASLLYYAQRLYQFPLGVFGVAIATAVFPVLSRFADDDAGFALIFRRGLRLTLFLGVPASVGLFLVREPLTRVIYAGGEFGDGQVAQVSRIVAGYSISVWAYALVLMLTRAFYARGNTKVPMRTGVGALALNLALSLSLIWSLKELGLALATAAGAIAQAGVLLLVARKRLVSAPVFDRVMFGHLLAIFGLGLAMGAAVLGVGLAWPSGDDGGWSGGLLKLLAMTGTGGIVYLALAAAMKRPELRWLVRGSAADEPA